MSRRRATHTDGDYGNRSHSAQAGPDDGRGHHCRVAQERRRRGRAWRRAVHCRVGQGDAGGRGPARGFLRKILVPAGETVPVLTVGGAHHPRGGRGHFRSYERGVAGRSQSQHGRLRSKPDCRRRRGRRRCTAPDRPQGGIFASPRARKTAREKGVDLALVHGHRARRAHRRAGRAGLRWRQQPKATPVAAQDGRSAGRRPGRGQPAPASAGGSRRPTWHAVERRLPAAHALAPARSARCRAGAHDGLRGIIAERMAASDTATARVTLVTEVDATAFVEARDAAQGRRSARSGALRRATTTCWA